MRKYLLLLAWLLLPLLVIGCTPGGRGGGGGGSDDDDSGPDDDDTLDDDDIVDDDDSVDDDDIVDDDDFIDDDDIVDDDDFIDDDDVVGCEQESEPNDDPDSPNDLGTVSSSFCIEGSILCGNDGEAFANDLDYFLVTAGGSGTIDFTLTWDGSSTDVDGIVGDETAGEIVHDFEIGYTPESGSFPVVAGNVYSLRVGCWEGQDGDWLATFTF